MKLISWNVNGLRANITKGFETFFKQIDADIFCIQETKMQEEQIDITIQNILKKYKQYWNSALKKGYSGTAVFSKKVPINVTYGIGIEEHDKEGRIITLEFEKFFLVNCYTPNSKKGLERLDYRMLWEDEIKKYLIKLDKIKPVIYCGDLNVAHEEIDLKNPKTNRKSAGFTDEERNKMTELLKTKYGDNFLNRARIIADSLETSLNWKKDPQFPGGDLVLFKYISSGLVKRGIKKEDIKINLYVRFIVNSTGKVSNPEILRGINKDIDVNQLTNLKDY